MPLLIVPLAPEDVGLLTLAELDALRACERVMFEKPDHPLLERLRGLGVNATPFDDEPEAHRSGWGLVADPDSVRVVELARAGAHVTAGPAETPDALTAALVAPVIRRASATLGEVVAIMTRLRSDDGCPWDRKQTHSSLKVHLLEEAYEVIDAIDAGQLGASLEEELGDVLLQVAFHSRLAQLEGRFDISGVASGLVGKLIHRHPHVFGDATVADAEEVLRNWESIKRAEKDRTDAFEGIPTALPALLTAYKTQRRAMGLGFAPAEDEARDRVNEALDTDGEDALGEALFWLVVVARLRGIDPEGALSAAVARFRASYA